MVGVAVATRSGVLIARHGSTWTVEKHLADQSPRCMAVEPGKPSQMYCGTGDGGLFRSRDGGRNWESVGPGIDHPMITAVDVGRGKGARSEEHTSELQSLQHLVCRLLLEKKNKHERIIPTQSRIRRTKYAADVLHAT